MFLLQVPKGNWVAFNFCKHWNNTRLTALKAGFQEQAGMSGPAGVLGRTPEE
jgi:hypothetical protein